MTYSLQEAAQGLTLQPQARCLVGLYSSNVKTQEYENEEDDENSMDQSLEAPQFNDIERARFLVGCQSVRNKTCPIYLITLEDCDPSRPATLTSQTFSHPDGEILGLTVLPAAPQLFVSVYSSVSLKCTETKTGARIWRLPSENLVADFDQTSQEDYSELSYVSTLPLDEYSAVKKVTSNPSETCADLACLLGPPLPDSTSSSTCNRVSPGSTFLGILRAPSSNVGNGEYVLESTKQLSIPSVDNYANIVDELSGDKTSNVNETGQACLSSPVNSIRWSPHRKACSIAVACDSGVLGVDLRSMQSCFWLEDIHWPCVRDLDFNPNRDHVLATAGDDGCVKVWDLRKISSAKVTNSCTFKRPAARRKEQFSFRTFGTGQPRGPQPLITLNSHSHWVWSVRYHPTRDQLLVSSASDSYVCLYGLPRFSSDAKEFPSSSEGPLISSTAYAAEETDIMSIGTGDSLGSAKLRDGLLAKLDQHEESVYAVDWSPVDTWVFASVNYDGNFLVNRVPDPVKLGILLHGDED